MKCVPFPPCACWRNTAAENERGLQVKISVDYKLPQETLWLPLLQALKRAR